MRSTEVGSVAAKAPAGNAARSMPVTLQHDERRKYSAHAGDEQEGAEPHVGARLLEQLLDRAQALTAAMKNGIERRHVAQLLRALQQLGPHLAWRALRA